MAEPRNTLFHARQKNLANQDITRSTRTHKRLRFAGMGIDNGGATEMIDTRGWDAVRWHTASHKSLYFGTQTTTTSDSNWAGSAHAWYRMVKSGQPTERVQLKQKFSVGETHFQIWKHSTMNESVAHFDADPDTHETAFVTNPGDYLYREFWPSNYNGGHFAADNEGTGNEVKLDNSDIIVQPTNTAWPTTFHASMAETWKFGEWAVELVEPWDPTYWTDAEGHEHTKANNGHHFLGQDLYFSEITTPDDYRPMIYRSDALGFGLTSRTSGFCTSPPPFMAFRMRRLNPNRRNMHVYNQLFVDLYRRPYPDNSAELLDMSRGDSWQATTHE